MLNKKRLLKKSSTGLTLIEVLISLVITLVLFMALMQSALLSISSNTKNILRDEAVRIADERMRELRGLPFTHADLDAGTVEETSADDPELLKNIRNFSIDYTRTTIINNLADGNTKQISVRIMWEWQENTVANLNELDHTITSIKRRL